MCLREELANYETASTPSLAAPSEHIYLHYTPTLVLMNKDG